MSQELRSQLAETLQTHLGPLRTLAQSLRDEGRPNSELHVGVTSLERVHQGLERGLSRDFYKQGMSYVRKADKKLDDPTLTSLLGALKAFDKAWKARPLPNEAFVRELINAQLPLLATRTLHFVALGHDEGATEDNPKGGVWDYLQRHRHGVFVKGRGKTHLDVCFADHELADRMFKEVNKVLGKAIAKPEGKAKYKTFVAGGLSMATERSASRSGGAFPFDVANLWISNQKGKMEVAFDSL